LLFVGTYEHAIDAKQRLAIPSDIRDRLDHTEDSPAFYAVVMEGPTLCLYTEGGFDKRADELDASRRPAAEILLYEQMFYANAQRIEIDKQGRVRLPERLLELAGLGREVVIIGVKDHLQVHNREAWKKRISKLMAERPDLLMNPRRAMRLETDGPEPPPQNAPTA